MDKPTGGIANGFKDHLNISKIPMSVRASFETPTIKVKFEHKYFILSTIYRTPCCDINNQAAMTSMPYASYMLQPIMG